MTVFAGSASFRSEHNGGRFDFITNVSSQEDHEVATPAVERVRRIHASHRHGLLIEAIAGREKARAAGVLQSRDGIRVLPDEVAADWPADRLLPEIDNAKPAEALDDTLRAITARYGARTTDFVAMQLEYPRHRATP